MTPGENNGHKLTDNEQALYKIFIMVVFYSGLWLAIIFLLCFFYDTFSEIYKALDCLSC